MPERSMEIIDSGFGYPPMARCSICKRVFVSKPTPLETLHHVGERLQAEFDAHKCETRKQVDPAES
jgi:hypothetical protein